MYLSKKKNWRFVCHNCGENVSFYEFLERTNISMHNEYVFERFEEKKSADRDESEDDQTVEDFFDIKVHQNIRDHCLRIDYLADDHKAKKYLLDRKIPLHKLSEIYYTDDLNSLKKLFPNYEDTKFFREDRIVMPVQDKRGDLQGVITRSINPDSRLRYVNLLNKDGVLLYGIDKIDHSKPKFVLEGPLDSMFLPNAMAVGGADLFKCVDLLDDNTTYIFDNQPRNKHVVARMKRMAEMNKKIVVWPSNLKEKDINQMVLASIDILELINKHTYKELEALLYVEEWSKI